MNGFVGRVLRIDLSNQKTSVEPLRMEWARQYLGCGGLGARYLYDELAPGVDPLGPENKVVLATGPLTGTIAASCPKYTLVTKSPLTNMFIDTTAGGHFAPSLKYAGYDAIIIEGKAESPVYVLINDNNVEIKDAYRLWNRDVVDTEDTLKDWFGDRAEVLSIGPAGENLVRFASVMTGYFRAHGRGGVGAVLGSKNLKAIVAKGTGSVGAARPEEFYQAARNSLMEGIIGNPRMAGYSRARGGGGTNELMPYCSQGGFLSTRNHSDGVFEGAERIGLEATKGIVNAFRACAQCPMACKGHVHLAGTPYGDLDAECPEFETVALLGSNCGIDDLAAIVKMNVICADMGMDTMSAGNAAAWAMECYEKGILSSEDTGGLDLRFGDAEALIELLLRIGRREGIGDLLAYGVAEASRRLGRGSERYAVHVKGLGVPAYDPRATLGMGLGYATAPVGAHHTRAFPLWAELFGTVWLGADPVELDPYSPRHKARVVMQQQHWQIYRFNTGDCDFTYGTAEAGWLQNMMVPCTGWPDSADWPKIGERYINLTRMLNLREGLTRDDDTLPTRFFEDPVLNGPAAGHTVSRADFDSMIDEYYRLRGWDADGRPTLDKLHELGIEELYLGQADTR